MVMQRIYTMIMSERLQVQLSRLILILELSYYHLHDSVPCGCDFHVIFFAFIVASKNCQLLLFMTKSQQHVFHPNMQRLRVGQGLRRS